MKPSSSNASRSGDQAGKTKKAPKGKKTLPTMVYFKSFKNVQPAQTNTPWTGDEANTIKIAAKPIYEDSQATPLMTPLYPSIQRITAVFPSDMVFDDPEATLSFLNPEVDMRFSSALFLCLSKDKEKKDTPFYEPGTFTFYPQEMNPIGKYCIKIYENGVPIRFFIDDRIGCDSENKCMLLRHTEPNILNPTLFHKAFLRFVKFGNFTSLDVVTAFTGFIPCEVQISWENLQFWFGRSDSLVALYIRDKDESEPINEGLGKDRLFHILDLVDFDQHNKFVKLQCPGAQWRGRFSGYEEDTRHWTNKICGILEIDPETAKTANYFWMILDDVIENFNCIMSFSPPSSFASNLRKVDTWVPKESQFYNPPPPFLLHSSGAGKIQICTAPLLTTGPNNDLKMTLRRFNWSSLDTPVLVDVDCNNWQIQSLETTKPDDTFEIECLSKGGFVLQILSPESHLEFIDYSTITPVTTAEGDLPFYVCIEEYATNIFTQRFELIGKVVFNLDQPGNVSFAVSVTNMIQRERIAAILYDNDLDDVVSSQNLHSRLAQITPNKRGYTLLIFGLYSDTIFANQPQDLIGKWRLRLFSDVQLSDIVDTAHLNYTEVEGDCQEIDETHQISRHVLTGACEAVVVLETSQSQSLTLCVIQDDVQINSARGVGFVVVPSVKIPGEKETTRLIVRGLSSEENTGFTWKLRIFSTAPVGCKEDTAPAEKTAAAIAAWEKKRSTKPSGGKKSESKSRSSNNDNNANMSPPEINENVLKIVQVEPDAEGEVAEPKVLTQEEILKLFPPPSDSQSQQDSQQQHNAQNLKSTTSVNSVNNDPGDSLREQINGLSAKMNEAWDQFDQRRSQITKLFTPTPPKVDEK